jgi:hypothetical protein
MKSPAFQGICGLLLLTLLACCTTHTRAPLFRLDPWHIEHVCPSKSQPVPWSRVENVDEGKAPGLVGRWQSDIAPSGYWVIDRSTDGRYVEKVYSAKVKGPHLIGLCWGRWRFDKKGCHHILDGSNLPDCRRFMGKWKVRTVLSVKPNRFDFAVGDGERGEIRITSTGPLAKLRLPHPAHSRFGWSPAACGVIEQDLRSVPRWVRQWKP